MNSYYLLVIAFKWLLPLISFSVMLFLLLERFFSKTEKNLATTDFEDNFIQALL